MKNKRAKGGRGEEEDSIESSKKKEESEIERVGWVG